MVSTKRYVSAGDIILLILYLASTGALLSLGFWLARSHLPSSTVSPSGVLFAGIGTSLVAAGTASLLFSVYQVVTEARTDSLLRHEFRALTSAYYRRAAVEYTANPEVLYEKAQNIVQSSTQECVLTTDLRWFSRNSVDDRYQEQYVKHVAQQLKENEDRRLIRG